MSLLPEAYRKGEERALKIIEDAQQEGHIHIGHLLEAVKGIAIQDPATYSTAIHLSKMFQILTVSELAFLLQQCGETIRRFEQSTTEHILWLMKTTSKELEPGDKPVVVADISQPDPNEREAMERDPIFREMSRVFFDLMAIYQGLLWAVDFRPAMIGFYMA